MLLPVPKRKKQQKHKRNEVVITLRAVDLYNLLLLYLHWSGSCGFQQNVEMAIAVARGVQVVRLYSASCLLKAS